MRPTKHALANAPPTHADPRLTPFATAVTRNEAEFTDGLKDEIPGLEERVDHILTQDPGGNDSTSVDQAVSELEHAWLKRELEKLPRLERAVICWCFGIGGPELSIRQIGARLNLMSAGYPAGRLSGASPKSAAAVHAGAASAAETATVSAASRTGGDPLAGDLETQCGRQSSAPRRPCRTTPT